MAFPVLLMQTFNGAGYFGGGYTGSVSAEIDGICFSSEAIRNPTVTLSVARDYPAGVNSGTRGYWGGGGSDIPNKADIDGIQFNTEAAINPAAVLSSARNGPASTNSGTRGYFHGGNSGSYSAVIDGIQFDTEAAITTAITMAVARSKGAGVRGTDKGYVLGGNTAGYLADIDGIKYSDETLVDPAATLSVARTCTGISSRAYGYACGGRCNTDPYFSAEIDGINYSNEAAVNPAAVLSTRTQESGGAYSLAKGYIAAGETADGRVNAIFGFLFSTEACAAITAVLPTSRNALAGVSWTAFI